MSFLAFHVLHFVSGFLNFDVPVIIIIGDRQLKFRDLLYIFPYDNITTGYPSGSSVMQQR